MKFTFVYRTADICISALSKLRESADIAAVRYTNLNGVVFLRSNFCPSIHLILPYSNLFWACFYFSFYFVLACLLREGTLQKNRTTSTASEAYTDLTSITPFHYLLVRGMLLNPIRSLFPACFHKMDGEKKFKIILLIGQTTTTTLKEKV